MTVVQNITKFDALKALVQGRAAPAAYRALIVMTNSTVGTAGQEDVNTISAFTTLDEMNGANYVRKQLQNITITKDDTNDRAEMTFDPITWTALGAGTRPMKGVLIYEDPNGTNNDATNVPRWFLTGGFPVAANGLDYVFNQNRAVKIRL